MRATEVDNNHRIYFASDFHLGVPDHESSLEREKVIVEWLNSIEKDAVALYLMGDLFDFWFEYKKAVPKGYIRLLGQLAKMADQDIEINIFKGNHDLWMRDYFQKELGANIYSEPQIVTFNGRNFYLAHGDGLGPGDKGYKFLRKIFTNPFCQWLFARLHPNFGIAVADYFSGASRNAQDLLESGTFLGEDKELLVLHSKEVMKTQAIDYFIYGHRHYPIKYKMAEGSYYINLGDWISHFTYACFDGTDLTLESFNAGHLETDQ